MKTKLYPDKLSYAIEKVWSGESRRIDIPYTILGTDVTVRIYQTIPGLLRVDIRADKPENARVKRGSLPE